QERLAAQLAELSEMESIFFCNSGAEANEAAIKLARRYGHENGIDQPTIVVMERSFHGRTLATLSATGNHKIQQGFEPLVEGFIHIPYNDVAALKKLASDTSIVAVLVEPVQGEGGVNIPDPDYLTQLRSVCDQNNWLLMLDEIQTGIGRTGKMFAYQHTEITPDVCTLAKALGNGVPIGACMAKGKAAEILTAGTHGSTFGGNPLACAAALAVLKTFDETNLTQKATEMGDYLLNSIQQALSQHTGIAEIRGLGMMIGIQLHSECADLVNQALDLKTLINVTAGHTIRLLPPLIINHAQADQLVDTLSQLLSNR
ncbi:MAG TPA: aminotransferase class III-fold pyridoxal phosphate-dependent enzyme, partial [Crenotrichaceae bacterium]|nr:aminotransferase class III-fold pyridoxal phosphate-dependent enzyme [Crenotrichaceae bacterium]